jgi:hypothetical protein
MPEIVLRPLVSPAVPIESKLVQWCEMTACKQCHLVRLIGLPDGLEDYPDFPSRSSSNAYVLGAVRRY